MIRCKRECLLGALLIMIFVLPSTAQVKFVTSPPGTVYIPPTNSPVKTVRCTTNVTANIKWVHSLFNDLDPTTFNIAQENSISSIMLVHQSFAEANAVVLGILTSGSIVCQAGTTTSAPFTFRQGAAPSVKTSPVDQSVNEGADFVEFNCNFAEKEPEPTFSWTFTNNDGHMETVQEQPPLFSTARTSLLEYLQFQGTKVSIMIVFLRMNMTKPLHCNHHHNHLSSS
ncbi:uncharacterized protein LOC134177490 [Corticium candelabrum]|uniref:uncharacterized protein LOC134177490 n=1 Tax=Corticium candelabrum TaxID=121492 RepID=UPI002E255542|nr:uncharacterized protein LOC134177490 [Corticium candelabrum]